MAFKYFKISSGKIVIADPCYSRDAMIPSNLITNVATGVWTAEITRNNMGRIASLTVYNNVAQILDPSITTQVSKAPEIPFLVNVDSGMAGFFDADQFKVDDAITDEPLSDWIVLAKPETKYYSACVFQKHTDEHWGTIHSGAIAQSGYGDGSYKCLGLKDIYGDFVALTIIFIETYEDYSDDSDDEEDTDDEI